MKNFKIKGFYSFTALAAIIPLIIMLIITLFYIDRQETLHQRELMGNAQTDIAASLEKTLQDVQEDTASLTTSMDYLVFCNSSASQRIYYAGNSVLDTLQNALQAYPEVIGIFLYNTRSEQTISHYAYTTLALYQERISEILKAETPENLRSFWRAEKIDTQPFIFLRLHRRYGNLLIVLDPRRSERYAAYNLTFRNSASYTFYDAMPSINDDVTLTTQIQPLGLYLVCQTEGKTSLATIQFFFLLIVLFFFLVAMGQIMLFQRKVITPFQQISASLKRIAEGDLEYRLQTSDTLPEIQNIAYNINDMLQKIQDYKEEGFRLRMDAVQAKLQFLQLQIKPHFYLNCLKSVNALLNLHEYENAQTLVLTLSNYITHTFGDTRSFIPLRSELEAVQSYVILRNLTFSMNIQLHFQLDGRCAGAQCLPMSVLTFVENSIKHAGETKAMDITIKAEIVTQGSRPQLVISISDTGKGFPAAFLEAQRHADPSKMVYRRTQVGISNIRYRLWLTYENEATLTLENRDNHANVTLCIPYEPMEEGSFS